MKEKKNNLCVLLSEGVKLFLGGLIGASAIKSLERSNIFRAKIPLGLEGRTVPHPLPIEERVNIKKNYNNLVLVCLQSHLVLPAQRGNPATTQSLTSCSGREGTICPLSLDQYHNTTIYISRSQAYWTFRRVFHFYKLFANFV